MFIYRRSLFCKRLLLAGFAGGMLVLEAIDILSAQTAPTPQPQAAAPANPVPAARRTSLANHVPMRAYMYNRGVWGVDSLTVKYTESGRDDSSRLPRRGPGEGADLNDKKAEPSLIDPQAEVRLVVPEMKQLGKLRQSSTPIAGKSYWMAFSNSGRRLSPGDRVDVVIGQFHAAGLIVE